MASLYRLLDLVSDDPVNLVRCLLKARMFAARLPGKKFAEWIARELEGYPSRADVPGFRVIPTPPVGHFSNLFGDQHETRPFETAGLPPDWRAAVETYTFVEHAKAVESLLSRDPAGLVRKWDAPTVAAVAEHPTVRAGGMVLTAAESPIPKAAVENVLHAIRTVLFNFLLELWERYPDLDRGDESVPASDAAEIDRLAEKTIYLARNPHGRLATADLTVSLGNAIGPDPRTTTVGSDPVQQMVAELADAITGAVAELDPPARFEAVDEFESLSREAHRESPRPERLRAFATGLKAAFDLVAGERPTELVLARTDALLKYFGVAPDAVDRVT